MSRANYFPEERETIVRYDDLEGIWYFETNSFKHVNQFKKRAIADKAITIDKEEYNEGGNLIYIRAHWNKDFVNFSPYPTKKKNLIHNEQLE
ncbi:hypothetical protein ACFO26_02920 [Lactococcus nasutitermitis]|uniref:Uncharacterized protein n=1 Tax=Lactococcus nasutitermitis TaxID=1652957 RepID=A0ABV9JCY4_9LACT|nr:hypothetical protein [Lactococcus nasutitermitis]